MAVADREAILEYIAQDNVQAAIELDEEFEAKAEIARQRPTLYKAGRLKGCLLYTSPSPRDRTRSRMPSSA